VHLDPRVTPTKLSASRRQLQEHQPIERHWAPKWAQSGWQLRAERDSALPADHLPATAF
jgi:hypothetical protein